MSEDVNYNTSCNFSGNNTWVKKHISQSKKIFYCNGVHDDQSMASSPHPKVYLKFDKQAKEVVCPYCGTHFVFLQK